jgi:hypothetical protein
MLSREPQKLELGPDDARRVYWLTPPKLHERNQWRRAILANGGKRHGRLALLDIMAAGVAALMEGEPPEIIEALLAKIGRARQSTLDWIAAINEGEPDADIAVLFDQSEAAMRDLAAIEEECVAHWPPYAAALADDATYWPTAGIEGARIFLTGWEGLEDAPRFKRSRLGVADELLAVIPEQDHGPIGLFLDRLARVTEPERKNSSSLPATSSGSEISHSSNGAMSGPSPSLESSPKQGLSAN